MSVLFVFANLWFTDGFEEFTNAQMHTLMYIAAAITMIFSVFIISYVQWYMMRERSKGFSILLSYGMSMSDLKLFVARETLLIYLVSIIGAFITGSVFSKLFFMISTKLLMIDQLKYQLTIESFLVTAIIFAAIFLGVLLITIVRISRSDIITLSKMKSNPEMKQGKTSIGFIGILLILGSLTALYQHNNCSGKNVAQWILMTALLCIIGAFLFIKHFSSLLYVKLKANGKRYYSHILESTEFAISYKQNVKTLFVLSLLTIGIILFTTITYTLNHEAYHMTETENPHDLYFEDFQAEKIMEEQEIDEYFNRLGTGNFTRMTLPFLYMEAPDMIINNWRNSNWVPIVSETDYNRCFNAHIKVEQGDLVQIVFESRLDHTITYFEGNDIILKNSISTNTLRNTETIYDKILNRYVFTQGLLFIVNDFDYDRFLSDATDLEKGFLSMIMFDDWKKSNDICKEFSTEFYNRFEEISMANKEVYHELMQRYGYAHMTVRAKIDYFNFTKLQGSFSLFIMGFVSILFAFCIFITYYFKVFMEATGDRERFRRLDGIGFLKKEKERLIKIRIKLIMFVPTVLGIIIGIGWGLSLNMKKLMEVELTNGTILKNAIIFSGIYCIMIIAEYIALTNSYIRRLNL
jgi:hypothetical protein